MLLGNKWGVVGARNLFHSGQSYLKNWGSSPPQIVNFAKRNLLLYGKGVIAKKNYNPKSLSLMIVQHIL
jgi:hypothetical protein